MFRSQKSSPQTTNRLVLSVALALAAGALLSQPAAAQSATVHLISAIANVGTNSANPNANLVDATPVNLISDIVDVGTNPATPDTNLVNPWGLVASAKGPWWVSDNGSGHSTLYDGTGSPIPLVVSIPQWDGTPGGSPTGIVFNGTSDFALGGNATHFLFATEDGTIQGWSSDGSTVIAVNNFPGAVYKGLALASAGGANYLYVANFRAGSVDVFDKNFAPHSFGPDAFLDFSMPAGYAPFNVANVGGGKLAVTYALQDGVKHDDVAGIGHGYVIIYDTEGKRLFRLQHVPYLNSPWAVVVAPRIGFGAFGGDFLVGQFGSGAIVAYDSKGNFEGLLFDPAALPLRINGLWGLGFGNGASSGPTTTLYFTAGVFDEAHGIFGSITCCSAPWKTW